MSCTCIKKEVGSGKGKVKGYAIAELCPECLAKSQANAAAEVERKKEADANLLIAQRNYDNAKAELILEGKIEEKNGKISIK